MFVDEARKRLDPTNLLNCNPGPGECHPNISVAQEDPEFEAGPLRAAVLEGETDYPNIISDSRVPYLLVMAKYQPITSLTRNWDEFMIAFFALFYCHAMLWSVDIQHGAISETDLLWNPDERKPKLCDFDLSQFCDLPQICVLEKGPMGPFNTGTWIFVADELLTGEAMEGTVKRVYRHEVEALVTVLVWIACRYKDGESRPERPLKDWNKGNYLVVKDERTATFNEIRKAKYPQPDGLPDFLWTFIQVTLDDMSLHKGGLDMVKSDLRRFQRFPAFYLPPVETPEDFDDLRALRKMLSWVIFTLHPSAEPFAQMMKERILNPSKQQETRA